MKHPSKKTILIASNSDDRITTKPVAKLLKAKGYHVILYEADSVATKKKQFSIHVQNKNVIFSYNKRFIDPTTIAAAWYRRPNMFGTDESDWARAESLAIEYRAMQKHLWDSIPDERWLNEPDKIRHAEEKMQQLITAQEVGFEIPQTVISTDWKDVQALPGEKLLFKMPHGILNTKEGEFSLYSKIFLKKNLPLHANPYPGIWQPFIEKKREWRITVIGETVLSCAIYTTKESENDWREHQDNEALVQFKAEALPEEEKKKCIAFLKHYGLRFGAFDMIETHEGTCIFLECNPNGQFGWMEDELGLPMAETIANELIRIAESS